MDGSGVGLDVGAEVGNGVVGDGVVRKLVGPPVVGLSDVVAGAGGSTVLVGEGVLGRGAGVGCGLGSAAVLTSVVTRFTPGGTNTLYAQDNNRVRWVRVGHKVPCTAQE